jgi:hypothetical protein
MVVDGADASCVLSRSVVVWYCAWDSVDGSICIVQCKGLIHLSLTKKGEVHVSSHSHDDTLDGQILISIDAMTNTFFEMTRVLPSFHDQPVSHFAVVGTTTPSHYIVTSPSYDTGTHPGKNSRCVVLGLSKRVLGKISRDNIPVKVPPPRIKK